MSSYQVSLPFFHYLTKVPLEVPYFNEVSFDLEFEHESLQYLEFASTNLNLALEHPSFLFLKAVFTFLITFYILIVLNYQALNKQQCEQKNSLYNHLMNKTQSLTVHF